MILKEINRYSTGLVFLQETYISHDTNVKLYSKHHPKCFFGDSSTKRAKVAAIGFVRDVQFVVEDWKIDPEGRYMFLKVNYRKWSVY